MKLAVATDFAALPLILLIPDIQAVYRISESTIRRGLQDGTFRPRPFGKYPYRWRKEAVVADLKRDRDELPRRPHGFASARARVRPAKASLDPAPTRRAR